LGSYGLMTVFSTVCEISYSSPFLTGQLIGDLLGYFQALDIATREFAAISREREARAENEVGLRYINDGRHRRALRHFRRASFLDNDQAAYNVGQCYELGLGTRRNIRKVNIVLAVNL